MGLLILILHKVLFAEVFSVFAILLLAINSERWLIAGRMSCKN